MFVFSRDFEIQKT
uniref:Uncharacterized protein n=1 Tax=Rhizophora mucronata TaxID=61149 RepID=A0A2P2P9Z4_RHIMU